LFNLGHVLIFQVTSISDIAALVAVFGANACIIRDYIILSLTAKALLAWQEFFPVLTIK
jgi:hypothetical protein